MNGWDKGILQSAVDKCNCDQYGDVRFVLAVLTSGLIHYSLLAV
jgi:hypothetical protein